MKSMKHKGMCIECGAHLQVKFSDWPVDVAGLPVKSLKMEKGLNL